MLFYRRRGMPFVGPDLPAFTKHLKIVRDVSHADDLAALRYSTPTPPPVGMLVTATQATVFSGLSPEWDWAPMDRGQALDALADGIVGEMGKVVGVVVKAMIYGRYDGSGANGYEFVGGLTVDYAYNGAGTGAHGMASVGLEPRLAWDIDSVRCEVAAKNAREPRGHHPSTRVEECLSPGTL